MKFVTCRKDLVNPDRLGELAYCEVKNNTDPVLSDFDSTFCEGERVLLVVHGYNEPYAQILEKMLQFENLYSSEFDSVVGFLWPGGDHFWEFFGALMGLGKVSKLFADLLSQMNQTLGGENVNLWVHSLGNAVVLKALNLIDSPNVASSTLINHYYSFAASIDAKSLDVEGEYYPCLNYVNQMMVCYAKEDWVTSRLYYVGDMFTGMDSGLGGYGPQDFFSFKQGRVLETHSNVVWVDGDCSNPGIEGGVRAHTFYYDSIDAYEFVVKMKQGIDSGNYKLHCELKSSE
ncbi:alpha/beta hydrolase [bacterium]|nr:alpha/beta hydrolase [bacterium]